MELCLEAGKVVAVGPTVNDTHLEVWVGSTVGYRWRRSLRGLSVQVYEISPEETPSSAPDHPLGLSIHEVGQLFVTHPRPPTPPPGSNSLG